MLYFPTILIIDGTIWCMIWERDTGAKGGGTPWEKNHSYQCKKCVFPYHVAWGLWGSLWSSGSGHYLIWKARVSCRTTAQMCGSWNFPRFLLRDGSLTLMNMASLMVLVMLWTSLPEKLPTLMPCPEDWACSYMGEGALRCSLSPKGPS